MREKTLNRYDIPFGCRGERGEEKKSTKKMMKFLRILRRIFVFDTSFDGLS
jgi:hypothetical protein